MRFPPGIPILLVLLSISSAQALILGTFNIRYDNPDDAKNGNGWAQRAPVIASLIRFHNFDVLGTQEAYRIQLDDLQRLLTEHRFEGVGRDDGKTKGEHAAIFFKKDKFRLLESGTFWLSETPEQPGVRGWDADLPRICTWVKLARSSAGAEPFWVFNVHFDHRGVQARLESSRLLLRKIEEMAAGEPAVLMGDFNVNQHSESYRLLHESALVSDSRENSPIVHGLNGTFNNFDTNAYTESRIDHVFLSPHFKPLRHGVLTDFYWQPLEDEADRSSSSAPT
jgi:endonuclease/exonuclease/phosphatase family metal-dependent hydrolase